MSGREQSRSSSSCSSNSDDSDDIESVTARVRADDFKQRLLHKLYPTADSPSPSAGSLSSPAAPGAECAANHSTNCSPPAECRLPVQLHRVYTAAAGPMLVPAAAEHSVSARAPPAAAADVGSSGERSAKVSVAESSDDDNGSHARRRRRKRKGHSCRARSPVGAQRRPSTAERSSSSSGAEPASKSPASDTEPLAAQCSSQLSKNRKRKLKKRRHRKARRSLADTGDPGARAAVEAKEFVYDDTAEVNERRLLEEGDKACMIKEIQEFVSAVADMHAYESHVSWSSTLDSLAKQTAVLDLASLRSLRLIKTLLVLNDKERSRDAMTMHLGNTSPLSPDVKDMLTLLFNYWLTSVMA